MARSIPDPLEHKVLLPVRIVNGVPHPFYGGSWPPIEDGAIGDLVLPAWALKNPHDATLLTVPLIVPILKAGERLLVGLKPTAHSHETQRPEQVRILAPFEGFAEIHLKQELRLRLRGTKKVLLEPCDCWIPALGRTVGSVNQAYTVLSMRHEPHRVSHTGNVFQLVFFLTIDASRNRAWKPLQTLRDRMEAKLEARFQKSERGA